ncbi:MAG: aminopeptidase P N-terminal domain-containing protein [Oscillospiraceae bacterium]|jgi:Xaa-Pro aminopeptidase|nr:M24 family metallopeptidase [Oscillospiraceae bacterium]MDE6997597.1 aminopeptidase P N-terminal domain-containing protein [Oscillospiraceae bacterium]
MTSEFFTNNRKKLMEKLEEGSVVLLYSGVAPVKSNDQEMSPFSVNRNFYYMTGIDTANVWLIMVKDARGVFETLFIDEPDEFTIKWNGKMLTREEASESSGLKADRVRYMQDLESYTASALYQGVEDVYFSFDRMNMKAAPTRAEEYARTIREKFPMARIKNAAKLISSLRSIKTPEEIDCIRRADDVTIEALKHMLRTARPGEYEYQWQADYEYYVARSGLRHGFETIAAAGENAVMLHYSDNNCVARDGDLLLVDLGAEYKYYSADVSRTFPINGKFTDRQKELFTIVKEAMAVAKEKMRPGVATKESNQAVLDFYKKALRTAKLITDDSDVSKYYYHGVSHSLGLDTHDPCDRKEYEPGMVVTCEPGLYVAEEGIGIRLENDVLVTEGAAEDLTGDRLLDIREIEELMAR